MKTFLVIGPSAYVRELRWIVNSVSRSWRVRSISQSNAGHKLALLQLPFVDAVGVVGGPRPHTLLTASARRLRKPLAIIWTGPDVSIVGRAYNGAAQLRARRFQHAALTAAAQNDLHALGVDATLLPALGADDDDACVREFEDFFERVSRSAPLHKRRAVVSGSSRRVAAFLETASRTMPDWEFHAAISGSRAERFVDALALIFAERWYRIGDQREDRIFRLASTLFRKQRYKGPTGAPVIDLPRGSRADTESVSAS